MELKLVQDDLGLFTQVPTLSPVTLTGSLEIKALKKNSLKKTEGLSDVRIAQYLTPRMPFKACQDALWDKCTVKTVI